MLSRDLPPDSVIDGAFRQAISDALHDPEFVRSLAERIVDVLSINIVKYDRLKLSELKQALEEGIASGRGGSAEHVFDRLEKKYTAMATGSGV